MLNRCLQILQIILTCLLRGSIPERLTSWITGMDLSRQVNLLLIQYKQAAESKPVKQEVSCTVTLPLVSILCLNFGPILLQISSYRLGAVLHSLWFNPDLTKKNIFSKIWFPGLPKAWWVFDQLNVGPLLTEFSVGRMALGQSWPKM